MTPLPRISLKGIVLFAGPLLFLAGQLLAPGGSPDPTQRQAIIIANQTAWELSHRIFVISFAFLLWWLFALWHSLKTHSPLPTAIGAFVTGFALLADFGIATLQFVALEAVRTLPTEQAQAVIALISNSQNLQAFVYLPYFGFVIGLSLLAWSTYQARRRVSEALLLALTGLLLVGGGMTGNRQVLIGAGMAWVVFTLLWARNEWKR